MTTHFVVWEEIVRVGWSRALCGAAVAETELAIDPTCPACQHQLRLTAEEVFGPAPEPARYAHDLPGGKS